jgi:hypothetical protein
MQSYILKRFAAYLKSLAFLAIQLTSTRCSILSRLIEVID